MPNDAETPPTPSKAEIIKKIGRALEEKRKARGWTQEKVGQNLKFRTSFVKALEEGNWQETPGEVYGRGFSARYAQLLGLDPKELLAEYFDYINNAGKKSESDQGSAQPIEFSRSIFVWAGAVLIVLVAIIKFITADLSSTRPVKPQTAAPPEKSVAISTQASVNPRKPSEHELNVYSPLPLWLSIKTENKNFEGFIPQSSTWTMKGEGLFHIRLGHTQQVALTFDGKPVPLGENEKRLKLPSEN